MSQGILTCTPEIFNERADKYLSSAEVPSMPGLALACGFTDTETMRQWGAREGDQNIAFRRACARIEEWTYRYGMQAKNPAMAIFASKAVFKYSDKGEEQNRGDAVTVNLDLGKIVDQAVSLVTGAQTVKSGEGFKLAVVVDRDREGKEPEAL